MAQRVLKWFGSATLALCLVAGIAYATTPGYHRVLTPALFDMTQVTSTVYIDDPNQAGLAVAYIAIAEGVTKEFFGELRAQPTYIMCTTEACKERFALRPSGLSLGYQIIMIAPKGFNPLIISHERVHAELHRFMGISDLWDQRFPAWFNEGLASHISGDTRLNMPSNARDADWVRRANGFFDWRRLHKTRNWQDTYGAAARLVAEIEAQIGRDGLLILIKRVGDGADFTDTLAALIG